MSLGSSRDKRMKEDGEDLSLRRIEMVADGRKTVLPEDRSILIIEDDPIFLKILRDMARENGFKCLVANQASGPGYIAEQGPCLLEASQAEDDAPEDE